jgi:hypothetical protein
MRGRCQRQEIDRCELRDGPLREARACSAAWDSGRVSGYSTCARSRLPNGYEATKLERVSSHGVGSESRAEVG